MSAALQTWTHFVKEFASVHGLTYGQALVAARDPWREYKAQHDIGGEGSRSKPTSATPSGIPRKTALPRTKSIVNPSSELHHSEPTRKRRRRIQADEVEYNELPSSQPPESFDEYIRHVTPKFKETGVGVGIGGRKRGGPPAVSSSGVQKKRRANYKSDVKAGDSFRATGGSGCEPSRLVFSGSGPEEEEQESSESGGDMSTADAEEEVKKLIAEAQSYLAHE